MTNVFPFPNRTTIVVIDQSASAGGYMVEPRFCPGTAGRGRSFPNHIEAWEYAGLLAAELGCGFDYQVEGPEGDGPFGGAAA